MIRLDYPLVLDEIETVAMLKAGRSIARYGDGELKLCRGSSACAQEADPVLKERLKAILKSPDGPCLVGIPRINNLSQFTDQKRKFWAGYLTQTYLQFYDFHKTYGSAFITRPDSIPAIYTDGYFDSLKSLWTDRHVVLVNGDNRRFDKDPSILAESTTVGLINVPGQNAFAHYGDILRQCKRFPLETLFILAAGPTASVLAFDLAEAGYQALDLGHFGMFYARFRRGEEIGKESSCQK